MMVMGSEEDCQRVLLLLAVHNRQKPWRLSYTAVDLNLLILCSIKGHVHQEFNIKHNILNIS